MTRYYKNHLFGTLWVKRPATIEDIQFYKQRGGLAILEKRNRNKQWYCVCIKCQKTYVVGSNYLSRKKCQCQKNR